MKKHIKKTFQYPEEAKAKYIEGVVYLMMTIETDGTITNIRTKGPHPILEAEAVRIIELLPRLQPAILKDKAIAVPYTISIIFKLWQPKIHAVVDIGLRIIKGESNPAPGSSFLAIFREKVRHDDY